MSWNVMSWDGMMSQSPPHSALPPSVLLAPARPGHLTTISWESWETAGSRQGAGGAASHDSPHCTELTSHDGLCTGLDLPNT